MKQVVALIIITGFLAGSAAGGSIHEALEAALANMPANQHVATLVFLRDQLDLEPLETEFEQNSATLRERHEMVVLALQATALGTQAELLAYLAQREKAGAVRDFTPMWIANAIAVEALPAEIDTIAARDDVGTVYLDFGIELVEPVGEQRFDQPDGPGPIAGITVGVLAVRAPEVWDELGFDGTDILVATIDTGVDGNHEALRDRWRGVADSRYRDNPEWAWFDPITNTTFPFDSGSHGTHTTGTVCGGMPGEQIGVAPGAQWISAGVIDRGGIEATVRNAMLSFQWMVDPDGDPSTNWDVPDVCSNSWRLHSGHGRQPCDDEFWAFLDAVEAAGTVILFSAGNEGPGSRTVGRPPDRATDDYRTFAVGAIDANNPNWPIASFSSRGPSNCTPDGSDTIKPEISAPGVNVRSSTPGNRYSSFSGTSMASPHVNGVVALMRQANPDLPVDIAKQILFDTAVDLGPTGDDNTYGWGMIDAFEAVLLAIEMAGPHPPRVRDANVDVPVNTPTEIELLATDDGLPDPPGAMTFIVLALPAAGDLQDIGDGHTIVPGDLPYTLVNGGNRTLYSPDTDYFGDDSLQFKADDGGEPPDGGDSSVATVSMLVQFDPPRITTKSLPEGCLDTPYGPVQLEAEQGQPELTWSVVNALPDGLTLSPSGELSGTPTEFGEFSPNIRVTDSLGREDEVEFSLALFRICSDDLGDLNCDGAVNAFDIEPFLVAVFEPWNFPELYPDCDILRGDTNRDGSVNSFDIEPFIDLLFP